ncbi:Arc family DNA-binding protein [Pseudomonas sp. CCI3.2]|uniref:Arc family DNA-binding protein n=1 Tax=unclassified Pseudomonas TaxID=196821 RepID=UPI002AC8B733|nr:MULTISPECIES: Arc family DNA-binding protein [unclassified Pseudomonas]MEB0080007.1 Arc family DNA-binding protein [Pseudomonas sp. MH10out]MEB0103638.1 Arc family DNA-binding protein [Pseudomonas sp. CCI3.2]MEB0132930.1 Arc family DNA-binding protein [Pseudomonas sp. CCI2.4]MEB0160066.1 Arc family DNA-binding protein [Pseudomonas sp. AH2 (2023)]MEB0170208.1 Arc family DNA-binding protein [Pseudomonas sp. CCC4.4]
MNSRKSDREKFVIRFSELGLRAQIADEAKLASRSMNGEIVYRLFRSFELEEELRRANAVIDRLTGLDAVDVGRAEGHS